MYFADQEENQRVHERLFFFFKSVVNFIFFPLSLCALLNEVMFLIL